MNCQKCDREIAAAFFAQFGQPCLECRYPYVPDPSKWNEINARTDAATEKERRIAAELKETIQ